MASIQCVGVSKQFGTAPTPNVRDLGQQRQMVGYTHSHESRSDDAPAQGPVLALDGVNLTVNDGESMVIIGSSGCGKSTLLRCIAGLESYDGQIFYGEQNVRDVPPKDRGIGIVFQNYALYPQFEAKGNLSFFFKLRNREAEVNERVRQTSEIMGLGFEALLDRKPTTLSGGQKQRVAIARAICRDPKLLLFDEPLSNLDAQLRSSTRIEVRRLINRFAITTLYVTHDQTEATIMGDRLCVMDKGRIMQVGTYRELYDQPGNTFVAGFLGTPAMNLFEGVVAEGIGQLDGAQVALPEPLQSKLSLGERFIVGFRPEHVALSLEPPPPADLPFSASFDVIERIPSDRVQLLYATLGGQRLVARAALDRDLPRDTPLWASVPPEHVHAFAVNGQRI